MGVKIDGFGIPVCNSFQARILNDQLCYEVDLSSFSNKDNIQNELKSGFLFILDYNEDRQVTLDESNMHVEDKGLISRMMKSDSYQDASIYLNTIGQFREWLESIFSSFMIFTRASKIGGRGGLSPGCTKRNTDYGFLLGTG